MTTRTLLTPALVLIAAPLLLHAAQDAPPVDAVLDELVLEAERLEPLVESDAAHELLAAAQFLPPANPTTIYRATSGGYLAPAFTAAEYAELAEDERDGLRAVTVDSRLWYHTSYGSPLASIRAFDIAAEFGIESFEGARVLDFGFGSIGQLRLLGACGAHAVGTEVMPLLRALYADPDATGVVEGEPATSGSVELVFGHWPADSAVSDVVGGSFDLFVSKNTIKRGYVNPPVEVDPRMLLDFGVSHDEFLQRLHGALRPGGIAVFYNLGGKPAGEGEPYRPPTDIHSPWSRATYERMGFDVLVLDRDESEMARAYGRALAWDASMDLDNALFARVTVLRAAER